MFNLKNISKPLKFSQGDCAKAISLTKKERVFEICEPNQDGIYEAGCSPDHSDCPAESPECGTIWRKFVGYEDTINPCNGGNIQCNENGECTISSCRREFVDDEGNTIIDESCFPCTEVGCNQCQISSRNPDTPCVKVSGRGGSFGDVTYCKAKNKFCEGRSGDGLKKCLMRNNFNIREECDSINPVNMCTLNIDAEISGKNMCSNTGYIEVDSGNVSTWAEEDRIRIRDELFSSLDASLSDIEKDQISSCITNKITTNFSKNEFENRPNDDLINIMAQECTEVYNISFNTGTSDSSDVDGSWGWVGYVLAFLIFAAAGLALYFWNKSKSNSTESSTESSTEPVSLDVSTMSTEAQLSILSSLR